MHAQYSSALTVFTSLLQIYIGPSRKTVVQNRDVRKELQPGMLVATAGLEELPLIGTVLSIDPAKSSIKVQWMVQEKASHKPKWARAFKKHSSSGIITFNEILLYDFQLTQNGCIKKKSRDYLKNL